MNLQGRKVKSAKLHASFFMAGIGDTTTTLVANDLKYHMQMTVAPGGLFVEGKFKTTPFSAFIPDANCVGLELFPTETK
jgi:hypothetical protein